MAPLLAKVRNVAMLRPFALPRTALSLALGLMVSQSSYTGRSVPMTYSSTPTPGPRQFGLNLACLNTPGVSRIRGKGHAEFL